MCIIMNIKTQKITMEYNYYYLFLSLIMNILSNDYSTWNVTYSCMHEMKINLLNKLYNFDNNNAYATNWGNIKSQAFELATKNDTNIWMDKFPNANIGFFSQNNIDYIGVEPYNICNEYIVNPCIVVSTILDSIDIDV